MLVFDHMNSSLPDIFDDLFKPSKEQHSHNTRGLRRYVLNIPKKKTSSYGSRSVQVKSIKDWTNIIDKMKILWNTLRLSKNLKLPLYLLLATSITIFLLLYKMQPLPILSNNDNINDDFFVPLVSFCFSLCLSHII